MKISILTPCFKAADWLPQCVASIRDQVSGGGVRDYDLGVKAGEHEAPKNLKPDHLKPKTHQNESPICVHHHVQDACSTDGTVDFLREYESKIRALGAGHLALEQNAEREGSGPKAQSLRPKASLSAYSFSYVSEKDDGMYNALNRAFAATAGEVVGHLNADEQYLPGTLQFVADYFQKHPKVDVLFGAVVVTDADGKYICSRMPLKPQLWHTQVCHLCTFTAAMFFRRSAIEKLDCYFDESFKTAGDADLICRMLKGKLKMATVRRYFSVFADTGDNLALSPEAMEERKLMGCQASWMVRKSGRILSLVHRLRKLLSGAYALSPFTYRFIECGGDDTRIISVDKPEGRWVNRIGGR